MTYDCILLFSAEDSLTINLLKETGRFTQSVDYHSPHDLNIVMIVSPHFVHECAF